MDLAYPIMNRARHRKAAEAAKMPGTASGFGAVRDVRQVLLVTFKRSGEPVPTPVNHGLSEDGKVYFRSEPGASKIKRITNNPRVLIGPCNIRGKPLGPLAEARARILPPAESEEALAFIRDNWSRMMKTAERSLDRLGVPEVYVEVSQYRGTDS